MKKPHWLTIVGTLATAAATIAATGGIALPMWATALLTCLGGAALKVSPGSKPKDITGFPEDK
jgi:hypothetical protein